jgi:intracellular sulfur oxidation DsrE/DsrF family protein
MQIATAKNALIATLASAAACLVSQPASAQEAQKADQYKVAVQVSNAELAQAQKDEHYKLVIQVSDADPAKWNLALNNASNIQQELGKANVEIEIVAYGPGIGMLGAKSKVADRLAQALDSNIGLIACENSMRKAKLSREDMYSGVNYVRAGVVHIMKREREDWAYVRP